MVSLYLEVQGNLVSKLIMGITRVTIWVIGVYLTYLVSPPDPPSRALFFCVWERAVMSHRDQGVKPEELLTRFEALILNFEV